MKPKLKVLNVAANCPVCKTPTSFENTSGGREHGSVIINEPHKYNGKDYARTLFYLLRCATCGHGGMSKIHDNGRTDEGVLEEFYPISIDNEKLPPEVPDNLVKEFREAEKCFGFGANRAASAMFRSTLEKTLKANGYLEKKLYDNIENACNEGLLTAPRREQAHEDIRVLGNDVLHEPWREIQDDEVQRSHQYCQRVLEDFYSSRPTVEALLKKKNRIT